MTASQVVRSICHRRHACASVNRFPASHGVHHESERRVRQTVPPPAPPTRHSEHVKIRSAWRSRRNLLDTRRRAAKTSAPSEITVGGSTCADPAECVGKHDSRGAGSWRKTS
jgi:hypothetical protein